MSFQKGFLGSFILENIFLHLCFSDHADPRAVVAHRMAIPFVFVEEVEKLWLQMKAKAAEFRDKLQQVRLSGWL